MNFESIIGLEIHAQISTKTKMFCRCDNDSFDKAPNINVCPVCMGFPGQLPVLNKVALNKGLIAALALNCDINLHSKFDRKNYFYPDNPKGFQISQYDEPVSSNGFLDIEFYKNDVLNKKRIGITRLHLEDDAGKLSHFSDSTLIDFNRAGTPLMEIVSEPDIRSSKEASEYAKEIQKILRYVASSDADMEKGMMRFDASVSIRPIGESILYKRAEIKNLNSFKALEAAIDFEIDRQINLWKESGPMEKPITMGWDDSTQKTYFLREKEESDDYRYFPEPDIPELVFNESEIEKLCENIPEMPAVKYKRYINEFLLNEDDARILSSDLSLANYFEGVLKLTKDAKLSVSFINTVLMKYLREDSVSVSEQNVTVEMMGELINLVNDGVISNNIAKSEVFELMYRDSKSPKDIVEEKGLKQVSDTSLIDLLAEKIILENPDSIEDIKNGKDKAIGYLIGLVMKETRGQANPKMVSDAIKRLVK